MLKSKAGLTGEDHFWYRDDRFSLYPKVVKRSLLDVCPQKGTNLFLQAPPSGFKHLSKVPLSL